MGKALYRKYRSRNLDEILGQDHITTTLKNALKAGALSHAYLFTGPRGVGKTSIARILAHQVNGIKYSGEDSHMDIIEIDAASNRGIDEIRDLREKVNVSPSLGKYKVYIIDEVHMLTTPAFNALLKTLEEPPEHVIFILATTEAHKLPETIISRTQRYAFKPVNQAQVVAHLRHIADKEKIDIDQTALEMIAEHGEGSFRDSISLLDQVAGHGQKITAESVRQVLGIPPSQAILELMGDLASASASTIVEHLSRLLDHGYQAPLVAKQLSALIRQRLLSGNLPISEPEALELLRQLIEVPVSANPERYLELTLLAHRKGAGRAELPLGSTGETPVAKSSASIQSKSAKKPSEPRAADQEMAVSPRINPPTETAKLASDLTGELDKLWPKLLARVKAEHKTLYGILRLANPSLDDTKLTLTFRYALQQKRMSDPAQRRVVADAFENLSGQSVDVVSVHDKSAPLPESQFETAIDIVKPGPTIDTISSIFGGGELLES